MKHWMKTLMLAAVVAVVGMPLEAETLIEIDQIRAGDLEAVGFELGQTTEIEIEAVGIRQSRGSDMAAYAWIIDSDTREPVWEMRSRSTDRVNRSRALRIAEETKALEPGRYELYYYGGLNWYGRGNIRFGKGVIEVIGDIFDDDWDDDEWDEYYDFDDLLRDCYVHLSSDELSKSDLQTFEVTGDLPNALLQFNKLGDDEYIRQGFSLSQPCDLRVYSVFEFPRGNRNPVDNGWIIEVESREKVWEIDRWGSDRAGGGSKNRKYDDEIHLDRGDYVLHFSTDDSHSFEEFNVNPPFDPFNWGVTVLPGTNCNRSVFSLVDVADAGEPLVDLTRARDDDDLEQAFRLDRETTLHIVAIGEASLSDRELADYGWIQDAESGEIVWEMTYRNTDHAGGADKNRMYDGPVTLPKGDYIAFYTTDGSHSYRDWNASAPYDRNAWGLAIYPTRSGDRPGLTLLDRSDIRQNEKILASITRVRDDRRHRERFSLEEDTRVRIYALGEGQRGRMYDYGWIENARTGRTIWEMTYRRTDHAGGAQKNRVFDDVILLEAGDYEVYYETDGSHSYNDWNSRRPRDPSSWGITLSKVD
ncbi:MAG: hypothetical protein JSU65_00645 [Candidatus Zixiibacteriota bacterium]|nr:MAG: hypothetical protein JSU65_00645 [candidate division Zixibacteria bacterium]